MVSFLRRGLLGCFLTASPAFSITDMGRFSGLLEVTGDFHYLLDAPSSASGIKSVYNGNASLVFFPAAIGIGLQFDYGYQKLAELTVQYQVIAPSLSFRWGNPRVFWILSGAFYYPLSFTLQNAAGTFAPSGFKWGAEGRLTLGLRLNQRFCFLVQGGYRYWPLGDLQASGVSFLSGGANFVLSGIFAGLGLGMTL